MSKAVIDRRTISKYTEDVRHEAAIQYAITGSFHKIGEKLGIPDSTVRTWRGKEWFDDIVAMVREEKSQEHRARYSQLVDLAQAKAIDSIDKASPKDAMLIACMGTDKIRLADNLPTSISGKAESMTALAKQFQALSEQWAEKQARVIDEQ